MKSLIDALCDKKIFFLSLGMANITLWLEFMWSRNIFSIFRVQSEESRCGKATHTHTRAVLFFCDTSLSWWCGMLLLMGIKRKKKQAFFLTLTVNFSSSLNCIVCNHGAWKGLSKAEDSSHTHTHSFYGTRSNKNARKNDVVVVGCSSGGSPRLSKENPSS